jgi:hypothetical protein
MLNSGGMESVLRIQGPVTVSSDNLPEIVTLTAIHLRGAEFTGYFPGFVVEPGAAFKHTMHMNFRGLKPESGKPLTVQLTFEDNKGRRYPTRKVKLRAFPGPQMPPPEG